LVLPPSIISNAVSIFIPPHIRIPLPEINRYLLLPKQTTAKGTENTLFVQII
jgi:hypothetical protein